MKKFRHAVYIGRFQPVHKGHLEQAVEAFKLADTLTFVIGSCNAAESTKNPFSFEERVLLILDALDELGYSSLGRNINFVPVRDYFNCDNLWITDVQNKISEITHNDKNVVLVGMYKDESSYYLNMFPQWDKDTCKYSNTYHASEIRALMFKGDETWQSLVNSRTCKWLKDNFVGTSRFESLKSSYEYTEHYKKLWSAAPFPPTFVTTDAVVIQSGHVLLVKRKIHPGKGLLALPGGFVNQSERLFDACVRELYEETKIDVKKPKLKSSLVASNVFDYPFRSSRGRTITHAYCFKLSDGLLPSIKGSDDAEHALWLPLMDVAKRENEFFEDHCSIINYFINR